MKKAAIAFACFLAGMVVQEAPAAVIHFPRCPNGAAIERCECRAYVSTRFHICRVGQYCHRNAFHGMCW